MNYAEKVREFVVANFLFGNAADLRDEASFLDSGIVDSTGILELIIFLESTYGIKIESGEMLPENLDSVDKVVAFLERKLGATAQAPVDKREENQIPSTP